MPRKFFPFAVFILAVLACAVPSTSIEPTAPPVDEVQTMVAGTLTASAPHDLPTATQPPPTEPAAATAVATDTPVPVSPTATLAPPSALCPLAIADGPTVLCLDGPNEFQIADAGSGNSVYRVAVSPDGGRVAFIAARPDTISELWVANADGTNPRKLAGPEQLVGSDPTVANWPRAIQWQAGTHNLFFDTGFTPAGGPFGPGEYINSDLWVVNADTGSLSQMLTPGTGGFFSISPDGGWVAVSQPDSIDVIRADGATVRPDLIRFEPIITYSEYAYKPLVTWGADSTYFIVSIPSHDPLAADAGATLFLEGASVVREDEAVAGPGAVRILVRAPEAKSSLVVTMGGSGGFAQIAGRPPQALHPTGALVEVPLSAYHVVRGTDRNAVFSRAFLWLEQEAVLRPRQMEPGGDELR